MRRSNPISTTQIEQIKGKFSRQELPRITARVAREKLAEQLAVAPAPYRTYVDGIESAALESVRPGGIILFRFARIGPVIDWIYAELLDRSPVGPDKDGHYRDDHKLFINGIEVSAGDGAEIIIPPGAECIFLDTKPYSRKIEIGRSLQAPDGVYELTARAARKKFPDADIGFTYRAIMGGSMVGADVISGGSKRGAKLANRRSLRYPAIIVQAAK